MNYKIREMLKEDIKQVQDVAKISWNATYEGIIPVEIQENFLNGAYSDDDGKTFEAFINTGS